MYLIQEREEIFHNFLNILKSAVHLKYLTHGVQSVPQSIPVFLPRDKGHQVNSNDANRLY